MELTRGAKICYNLKKSPYFVDFYANNKPYRFYFSSALHVQKFQERITNAVENVENMFTKRFGFPVELPLLAAIQLYSKIETRGFFVKDYHGKCYTRNNFAMYGLKIGDKVEV